eukprot:TRINITY_DN1407_c0_g2_i1.p1 TRINITY_DN1407_c0_g2~~TRINITY_DN1407_c0_g2_i1.p1  ORF type:complete len:299 (+),score=62.65 TRINITY_DN1407_c0_g2_i1:48-944(+)
MTHTVDPATMDKSVPPPPCVIAGTPVEQATAQAKGFIDNVYHAMDSNMHSSIPFRADSIACFQKGAADRYQGQSLMARLQMMHPCKSRDKSGMSVQIFPGNSMLVLVAGLSSTVAAEQQSQTLQTSILHRFADVFLICSDPQGPHIKAAVFREIDEDCGAPTAGAVQGDLFTKADTVAQQFAPFFYGSLDDPAKRGGLTSMFKGESYVTIGQDLFKGTQHIAHKMHYMPQLINPTARKIEGIDAIPSPASGGFFLFIHGACQLAGEDRQQRFVDLFHLVPEGSNFWISNLIMKVHGGV